uniref:RNA-binding Raly-like protein isoform X2 n=1 Tax=Myxine glutinosa TaxID=7769 RepID=UPI00358FAC05
MSLHLDGRRKQRGSFFFQTIPSFHSQSSSDWSNVTNKNDPRSLNSRVFIGNLNTALVTREDVEAIFSKYGQIAGVSVHKGFAFVQYVIERCARTAVAAENGRVVAGQQLDINMAGEPKPNRPKATNKRQISAVYPAMYDYNPSPALAPPPPPVPPPSYMHLTASMVKRPRVVTTTVSRRGSKTTFGNRQQRTPPAPRQLADVCKATPAPTAQVADLESIKKELREIKSRVDSLLKGLEQMEQPQSTEAPTKIESQVCETSEGAEVMESREAVEPLEQQEEGDVAEGVKADVAEGVKAETTTSGGAVDCVENNCSAEVNESDGTATAVASAD